MRLFSWGHDKLANHGGDWRRSLRIDTYPEPATLMITIVGEYRFTGQEWRVNHADEIGIGFSTEWNFTETHIYYDGEHCIWAFGFLRIYRMGRDCKKCLNG